MAFRLFEGKDHASVYHKYRFTPPQQLVDIIIQYLDKKKGPPHALAVDLGCGTGQNTRLLAPHFERVVGIDISECQLEEARAVPGYPNVTYRTGRAEALPHADGSVDLLSAASAAHWFDRSGFVAEACRVLKPGGCVALLGFDDSETRFCHGDRGEGIARIYNEVKQVLLPYTSHQVAVADGKLEELYSAIPFPDKERVERFTSRARISVRRLLGFMESWSMFQAYKGKDREKAEDLLRHAERRFLEEMGAASPEAEMEHELEYFCVLASKPL